jgi:hypothetical protein
MTTDNFCFYLKNRLIQTSQSGGQQYGDTSPFSIPCGLYYKHVTIVIYDRNDSVQYHKTTITIVIDDP